MSYVCVFSKLEHCGLRRCPGSSWSRFSGSALFSSSDIRANRAQHHDPTPHPLLGHRLKRNLDRDCLMLAILRTMAVQLPARSHARNSSLTICNAQSRTHGEATMQW